MNKLKNQIKKLRLAVAVAIGIAASAVNVNAQRAGVYQLLSGGTTWIPSASTNTFVVGTSTNRIGNPGTSSNLVQTVSEFDNVGFTFAITGTATSTNSVLIYKSFDNGVTWEAYPSFSYLNIAPGAAAYVTNANLSIPGVTHLAFVIRSSGTTVATNALLEVNCKSPKYGARQATQ